VRVPHPARPMPHGGYDEVQSFPGISNLIILESTSSGFCSQGCSIPILQARHRRTTAQRPLQLSDRFDRSQAADHHGGAFLSSLQPPSGGLVPSRSPYTRRTILISHENPTAELRTARQGLAKGMSSVAYIGILMFLQVCRACRLCSRIQRCVALEHSFAMMSWAR
jgi:hypothetical protein